MHNRKIMKSFQIHISNVNLQWIFYLFKKNLINNADWECKSCCQTYHLLSAVRKVPTLLRDGLLWKHNFLYEVVRKHRPSNQSVRHYSGQSQIGTGLKILNGQGGVRSSQTFPLSLTTLLFRFFFKYIKAEMRFNSWSCLCHRYTS